MPKKKLVIIGDGKVAGDCVSAVVSRTELMLCAYVYHGANRWTRNPPMPDLRTIACENVNEPDVVRTLQTLSPDLIVNVNSFDILRAPLLGLAPDGTINFHNGPLPQYRGVNVPSWAIYNGEREHGVSWHLVEPKIDAGAIVARDRFPLEPNETAVTLIFKCLSAGSRLFDNLLDRYVETGALATTPQSGQARYFRATDIPNGGYIDFDWPREQLSRFIRALTFRPFAEPKLRPRFSVGHRTIYADTLDLLELSNHTVTPGTVMEVTTDHMLIASRDSKVRARELFNGNGEPIAFDSLQIRPGYVIRGAGS